MKNKLNQTAIAYVGIIFVVFMWAVVPLVKKVLIGDAFSASVYSAATGFTSACVLMILGWRNLKALNREYFKVAVPTGMCLGAASLVQALAYNFNASPTNQAFLENLSCIIVPIILFVVIKKKPTVLVIASSLMCLLSSMVLAGVFGTQMSFAAADMLNALAGFLYGVNIAFTGIYAKKFNASLYVMIQLFVQSLLGIVMAIAFNFICIGGSPIDPFVFSANVWLILALVGVGVVSNALCWTIRTSAMKHVSASVVAVIMPFSAVLTSIFAVMAGQDELTASLIVGAVLGITASLISSFGDIRENNKGKAE